MTDDGLFTLLFMAAILLPETIMFFYCRSIDREHDEFINWLFPEKGDDA